MSDWSAFWSYARDDDKAEGGRICRLARDLTAQYEMLTGDTIRLFLDRDALEWGDNWRQEVDESLASIAFFIPVLTPRYFMRPECRRELSSFARRAADLGVKEIVLPLLYVDVPQLHEETPDDELMKLVNTFHWEDWRDLRFKEVTSEEYRSAVAKIAERLVKATAEAQKVDIATRMASPAEDIDDAPGLLDRLAAGEDAMPKWTATIESISQDIGSIGRLMHKATADIESADSRGQGFVARLSITRKLSEDLRDPVDGIWSSSNEYVSQLRDVDGLVRAFIDLAPGEASKNRESTERVCSFFGAVRNFSVVARGALESTAAMIESISPLEAMSRDLRPQLKRLRQGLTLMLEAREIADEWVRLMDLSGVICEDEVPPDS